MIHTLFPYKLHLHIFQLDEYNPLKLLVWIKNHFIIRKIENKKPLVWTAKAKIIIILSVILTIMLVGLLGYFFKLTGIVIGIFLATQSYIFLIISAFLLSPLEFYKKQQITKSTKNKMKKLQNIKVIGVTGSYGKTSVKEFLYYILKTQYKVLKTPESFNTPFGVSRVVHHELTAKYDYFICEMGAYKKGEIKQICDIVHPTYGILTGLNQQHLDRFGSMENIIKTKFELLDALPDDGIGVVNGDNDFIRQELPNHTLTAITYGFQNKLFGIENVKTSTSGSTFTILLHGKKYQAKTKLLGIPNIQNILGAATMSYQLGISPENILQAISELKPVSHRLEILEKETMIIIDDAYNSNVDGFKESLQLLKSFPNPKVLVTPGIVELGDETHAIHKMLGNQINDIDHIILVGVSERTRGIFEGVHNKNKVTYISSLSELWKLLEKWNLKKPVVLLENDLPDNY